MAETPSPETQPSEKKTPKRKFYRHHFTLLLIIIRLIAIAILTGFLVTVCPLFTGGEINLECVLYILIIVILASDTASDASDLIPGTDPDKGPG
jgi:uncharacterized protein involved in response to NO